MYLFNFFDVIFPIFFLAFFGFITFSIIRGVKEWSYNNKQPIVPVEATIISKRESVSHHNHDGHMSNSTTYYVGFEFVNGERIEFSIPGRKYGLMGEGDRGTLTFQGSRFISFERNVI